MKKRVMMLALAAGVLLAAACEKVSNEPQTGFTLSATIANPTTGTKTTYTDPGDGSLKVGWEDNEKLSLLIWDPTDGVIKNYVLTGTKIDDKNCDFSTTETIDALTGSQKYFCIYPALTEGDLDTDSEIKNSGENLIYKKADKKMVIQTEAMQGANASPAHLKNMDLLLGEPTISGGDASVVLQRQIGVFKLVINVPEQWRTDEETFQAIMLMNPSVEFFISEMEADFSTGSFMNISESATQGPVMYFKIAKPVPETNQFVLYFAVGACSIPMGTYYPMFMCEEGIGYRHTTGLALSTDILLPVGKMTTLTIDASDSDKWLKISGE